MDHSGECAGWVLPCDNCGCLIPAPAPPAVVPSSRDQQGATTRYRASDSADTQWWADEWCWCEHCGFINVLASVARIRLGLDPTPLWPVSPARVRVAQRAIGEGRHAAQLAALLVRGDQSSNVNRKRNETATTTSTAPEEPSAKRPRVDSTNSDSSKETSENEAKDESYKDEEARAIGRLWAYADYRMRQRDGEISQAYQPPHRTSRFTSVHLQILETLYADELAGESDHLRLAQPLRALMAGLAGFLSGRKGIQDMCSAAIQANRIQARAQALLPVLLPTQASLRRTEQVGLLALGRLSAGEGDQIIADEQHIISAIISAHTTSQRREAESNGATMKTLLVRINAEIVRLAAFAVAPPSRKDGRTIEQSVNEDRVAQAQSCIPLWLRAYQALSAACLPA